MVAVSKLVDSYANTHVSSQLSAAKKQKTKDTKKPNTQNDTVKNKRPKEDCLVENTAFNRFKINLEKTADIPLIHFPRGLGGAPDYTFFEFLQTAKFPYYLGGPILAALFYAGVKKDNFSSANAAKNVAKHMALGVGFYYLGAAAAKGLINYVVKRSRGIDLNQPYAKVIPTSTNNTGIFKKDVEYHKVFESVDFTRWDLLYKKEEKNPRKINENYAQIAKKYGIEKDANDIDATVKPLIRKTIIMARAWQYALTAFFVTLGIGLANQPVWAQSSKEGFKRTVTEGIFGKGLSLGNRINSAKIVLYNYMIEPFFKSFGEFWKGHSKASSISGKAVILSTAAATLTAISLLLGKTSGKKHKIQNSGTNKFDEGKK